MICFQYVTRVLAVIACLFLLVMPISADDLEAKLKAVDSLRASYETDFDEVERQCLALLSEYQSAEEQGRIYFIWAHVEGQSGLQHPAKLVEYVKKSLSFPLDSEKRLQLHMYWGNALEVANRGVTGESLKKIRPEVVTPYLKAITESVKYIAETQATPLPPPPKAPSPDDRPNNRDLMARKNAEHMRDDKLVRLQAFQTAFENQIASVYSRRPFATSEIEALAEQLIPDKVARDALIARVISEVELREQSFRGDDIAKSPKRYWPFFLNVTIVLLLQLLSDADYRR